MERSPLPPNPRMQPTTYRAAFKGACLLMYTVGSRVWPQPVAAYLGRWARQRATTSAILIGN